jgi:hypothetical protein
MFVQNFHLKKKFLNKLFEQIIFEQDLLEQHGGGPGERACL